MARKRSTFLHGKKSGIGVNAVRLTAVSLDSVRVGAILIKASPDNSGRVYVGTDNTVTADSTDATDGFELSAGESVVVEIDDPSKIFVIASATGQKVFWIGV